MAHKEKKPKRVRFNAFYNFIRGLELEGTPLAEQDKGIAPFTSCRVAKMFGMVTREMWPYDPTTWPPKEPTGIDKKASRYRIHHYFRARNEQEIKHMLANGRPVAISVPLYRQWHSAENGLIQFPGPNETPIGMHSVQIIGYRDDHQYFNFQNSWGVKWGDDGFGWLPYSYFDQHGAEAICSSLPKTYYPPRLPPPHLRKRQRGIWESEWNLPSPIRKSINGITFFDHDNDEEVAWVFAFEERDSLDVEEFFVSPRYRKNGYARRLMKSLNELSFKLGKRLKFWLPLIDNVLLGQQIHDIAWAFNLRVEESPVKWAGKILVPKVTKARD